MSDVFISYARSTAKQAQAVAEALRALGYGVWSDDELPAHRAYSEVIEERLRDAKAVVVIWSAEAVRSEWVRAEANRAREERKLVQLMVDAAALPLPFDQTQCADLAGWSGNANHAGWRKVLASIGELAGSPGPSEPTVATPPPLPSKPSIAVLPFANLSGDPEQEYFADGMMDEVVTALTRIRSIFVIASGSTLSFKGKAVSAQDVGRLLGVRYVLEGSVRKAGDRVRIAAKLIDAAGGAQIWADRFEDTLDDVFALQDRVALAVAGKIEPTVEQAEIRRASARPTTDMGAYDLYLRALALARNYVRDEVLEAIDLAKRAVALDPNYAIALSAGALWLSQAVGWRWTNDPDADTRLGVAWANRALKLAGDDPLVIGAAALAVLHLERDVAAAVALMDRAVAANPGSSYAWMTHGIAHQVAGHSDAAEASAKTSMRLDPLSPVRSMQTALLGMSRFQQRQFEEAVPLFKEWIKLTDDPGGHALLAATYGHLGRLVDARALISRCQALSPTPVELLGKYWYREPAQRQLFLDGIALAEGRNPTEAGDRP